MIPRAIDLVGNAGLELTLIQDLGWKYHRYEQALPLGWEDRWACLGHRFDWVSFRRIERLEEFPSGPPPPNGERKDLPWEPQQLLLFDLQLGEEEPLSNPEVAKQLIDGAQTPKAAPLCVAVEMNLGRALLQSRSGPLAAVKAVALALRDHFGFTGSDYGLWGSLSRADLVLVGALARPEQLHDYHQKLMDATSWSISELQKHVGADAAGELLKFDKEDCEGHCFTRIVPLVGLNLNMAEQLLPQASTSPGNGGPEVYFRCWFVPGHEAYIHEVVNTPVTNYPDKDGETVQLGGKIIGIGSDTHQVLVKYANVGEAARVMRYIMSEKLSWWQRNVVATRGQCVLAEDPGQPVGEQHAPCQLTDEVQRKVRRAVDDLREFVDKCPVTVGAIRDQFRDALRSFETGLYRLDLLGATADLVPFIWQLSCALRADEVDEYLNEKADRESSQLVGPRGVSRWGAFSEEFVAVTKMLLWALRNRQERHGLPGAPPSPPTFYEGSCKILDAVSCAAWQIWDTFLCRKGEDLVEPKTGGFRKPYLDTESYATIICVSESDLVTSGELFYHYREWNERGLHKASLHERCLNAEVEDEVVEFKDLYKPWSAPLLYLEIPRSSLAHPNVFLPTLAHEIAELTDFPASDRPVTCDLRLELSRISRDLLHMVLCETFLKWATHKAPSVDWTKLSDEERGRLKYMSYAFFGRFISFVLWTEPPSNEFDRPKTQEERAERMLEHHPEELIRNLATKVLRKLFEGNAGLREYAKVARQQDPQWVDLPLTSMDAMIHFTRYAWQRYEETDGLRFLHELFTEVIADTGMTMILMHGADEPLAKRLRIVDGFFAPLLEMMQVKEGGARPEVAAFPDREHSLAIRWAIQIASMCSGDCQKALDHFLNLSDRWKEFRRPELWRFLKPFGAGQGAAPEQEQLEPAYEAFFGLGEHELTPLTKRLAKFKAYGGTGTLELQDLPSEATRVCREFRERLLAEEGFKEKVSMLWDLWSEHVRLVPGKLIEPC